LAQGIGRSRGGRTTKLHALVDGLGRPLAFTLTGGNAHDAPVLPTLLTHPTAPLALCADKAYDSQNVRQAIKDDGAIPVIPYKSNAKHSKPYNKRLYRERNLIERFFCRCKDIRRISQRFDKLARNFLAAVHLFAIRTWLSY
jgi:transposase